MFLFPSVPYWGLVSDNQNVSLKSNGFDDLTHSPHIYILSEISSKHVWKYDPSQELLSYVSYKSNDSGKYSRM